MDENENNNANIKNNIENLAKNYKILSIGLCGYLIEWCLYTSTAKQIYDLIGHSIMDASLSIYNMEIYIGCDDGIVRLINFENKFYLKQQFNKVNSPITSIAVFSNKQNSEEIFCTGHLNSSINLWKKGVIALTFGNKTYSYNTRKNKTIKLNDNGMIIDDEEFNQDEITNNRINTMCFINSKFLATGNQEGEVQIWDVEFGVLKTKFKEHDGDINSIVYSTKYRTLYFTGADSLIKSAIYCQNNQEFKIQSFLRPQSHDINCLLVMQNKNILISGGVTSDICLINLEKGRFIESFGKNNLHQNSKSLID